MRRAADVAARARGRWLRLAAWASLAAGCTARWSDRAGPVTMAARSGDEPAPSSATHDEEAASTLRHPSSLAVTIVVPPGWQWYERGNDLILTRDGVFLQNVLVECIEVAQTSQPIWGALPATVRSAKVWPLRTVANLQRRLEPSMAPADAADVVLQSRRHDPAVVDLASDPVQACEIAGHPAFRFTSSFRIDVSGPMGKGQAPRDWYAASLAVRRIPYSSVTCGFMDGRWCYCFTYTAARRHCFDESLATFEQILRTVELKPEREPWIAEEP
jgi:hypothetical protein